jgi:hypothetical protein
MSTEVLLNKVANSDKSRAGVNVIEAAQRPRGDWRMHPFGEAFNERR